MFVSIKTLHLSYALLYVLIESTKIVNSLQTCRTIETPKI